ncbi:hypothetical protein [Acinetobacter bereziniae]|uniref:hypothetical protein n=1 Tax=Acinetobacter bereziniae TaxID=106648 RepID=UPI00125057AE|nr:hypothetical protein [Acinetobacter bereziniae]
MFEEFLTKLLNPSISFLAIYVSVIVVIAYIGLLFQFFKIKNLKQENETLKHQLSSQAHSNISLSKHEGIIS